MSALPNTARRVAQRASGDPSSAPASYVASRAGCYFYMIQVPLAVLLLLVQRMLEKQSHQSRLVSCRRQYPILRSSAPFLSKTAPSASCYGSFQAIILLRTSLSRLIVNRPFKTTPCAAILPWSIMERSPPFGNLPVAGMGVYSQAPFGMDDDTNTASYEDNDGGNNYHQDTTPPQYHLQQQVYQPLLPPPQYVRKLPSRSN